MIRISFHQDAPGSRPDLNDDYEVFADVDLVAQKATITGAQVSRTGSRLGPYAVSVAELLDALAVNGTKLEDLEVTALAEAALDRRACCHCGRAEALEPGVCCGRCRDHHSELPACQAADTAGELVAKLRSWLVEEPILAPELNALLERGEAVFEHLAAQAARSTRGTAAA